MKLKKIHFQGSWVVDLLQNFRRLSSEEQILFGAHALTVIACFLPWASFDPLYGPSSYQSSFSGSTWLIGSFVFVLSLAVVVMYLGSLLNKKLVEFKTNRNLMLAGGSVLSLILLVCAWSVLRHVGQGYAGIEIRFGLALCIIAQIAALVSLWLQGKAEQKSKTQEFFRLPSKEKSRQSHTNHPKK